MKATKFRDSSEYSQCVQNVLAKSCLPCQISYKQKIFSRARKGLGTSIALQCYAGFVGCSFPCKYRVRKERLQEDTKVNCSFVSFFYLLSPYSARLCAPCDMTSQSRLKIKCNKACKINVFPAGIVNSSCKSLPVF